MKHVLFPFMRKLEKVTYNEKKWKFLFFNMTISKALNPIKTDLVT